MKKKISIQYSLLCISSRRMIFVFVIVLFASQSILHAEIENGSFDFDGRLRNYMVYLPTNYTGSTNFPLVIYLHCYGWNAQQGMNYTKLHQVADSSDFIVVYPSAIPNWNSGIGDNPSWPTPNVDDVGFINVLIDTMSNNYSIDPERIYACGYSNGGMMAYKLACQLSHRIAAIASVGGTISTSTAESCNPVRTVPILQIHGTRDPWVPINGSTGWYSVDQTLSYWINFNDCVQTDTTILPDLDPTDGCTVEKTTYTNPSDNCSVVYYKVINGGHTWPGAGPPGFSAGNTNQDIDASVEIWNFFKSHKLIIHPTVDFNGDGIVNSADMCIMVDHWGEDYSLCDIAPPPSGDGIVDVQDLIHLSEHLFEEIFPPELVAYWKLDEEEGDIAYNSIKDNYGILSGDPTWQSDSGRVAGALEFDGINDYVETGFVLDPAAGAFSVFAWIKGGAPGQVIISQTDGIGTSETWLGADVLSGNLMTGLRSPGVRSPTPPMVSDYVITDGQWHHVGIVVTSNGVRDLYADGIRVAFDTQTNNLPSSNGGLYFGTNKNFEAGSFFWGLIDDVRIYNRALTAEEIAALTQ
jgi:polyhydroxybutyrate depolymerase